MTELLLKIANTLVINLQNVNGIGLLNGKMGITVFFYHYSRFASRPAYESLADEMLDELFQIIESNKFPIPVTELSELGIGISHLIKNRFAEGDPDDVLHDIDEKLLKKDPSGALPVTLAKLSLYLLARLEDKTSSKDFSNAITQMLNALDGLYHENETGQAVPLALSNSLLFFLDRLAKTVTKNEPVEIVLDKVVASLIKSVDMEQSAREDLITFAKLRHQGTPRFDEANKMAPAIPKTTYAADIDDQVKFLWQNLLYFGCERLKIKKQAVSGYIHRKLCDLAAADLPLKNGLAGVGLSIIKNELMAGNISGELPAWPCFFDP